MRAIAPRCDWSSIWQQNAARVDCRHVFHGGGLVTDKPDSPHLLIPATKAQYLIAIAANDDARAPGDKTVLRAAFAKAARPAEVEVYDGTMHGWCPPDSRVYDMAAAEKAWNRMLALFDKAKEYGIGFYLGYAELTEDGHRFNTSILVDDTGKIVGKYRKTHLPGHAEFEPERPFQHLEKRYFEPGNLGFPVFQAFGGVAGMCICNDRRWPETYRVMGMQGVELIMLGYNTSTPNPNFRLQSRIYVTHNTANWSINAS